MAQPQIYEGTATEIAEQLRRSKFVGRLKAIVTSDELLVHNVSTPNLEDTLADFLTEVDQAEFIPGVPHTDPHEQNVGRLIAQKFARQGHTK